MINVPNWLKHNWHANTHEPHQQARQEAWLHFMETGLPNKKNEKWKYTDLTCLEKNFSLLTAAQHELNINNIINIYRLKNPASILLVLINGRFVPSLSDLEKVPEKKMVICRLQEAWQTHHSLIEEATLHANDHVFANLNTAMWQDGLFLYVPDNTEIEAPIHLLSLVTDPSQFAAHARHVIAAGKCANLTLLTEYVSTVDTVYLNHVDIHMLVLAQAKLHHCKIQRESPAAIHLAQTFIKQHQDSEVVSTYFTTGSLFSRDDVVVKLLEKGADCRLAGFYYPDKNQQYIDHHVYINHHAPHTKSDMLYKGIADNKSRSVFNGEVWVGKTAQKISANQANHHLLLSPLAEVYAKPVLEIYADDVKCQHGATTGQLDTAALFYLCSRGISKSAAIKILLQSFVQDILEKVTHLDIKQHIKEVVCFD